MPRANRHYIPGYVRHLTHRCYKKDFFLNDLKLPFSGAGLLSHGTWDKGEGA